MTKYEVIICWIHLCTEAASSVYIQQQFTILMSVEYAEEWNMSASDEAILILSMFTGLS